MQADCSLTGVDGAAMSGPLAIHTQYNCRAGKYGLLSASVRLPMGGGVVVRPYLSVAGRTLRPTKRITCNEKYDDIIISLVATNGLRVVSFIQQCFQV
jgi:hypothetical protein